MSKNNQHNKNNQDNKHNQQKPPSTTITSTTAAGNELSKGKKGSKEETTSLRSSRCSPGQENSSSCRVVVVGPVEQVVVTPFVNISPFD